MNIIYMIKYRFLAKLKPNIFLITIDSLRADKTFGQNKSSVTPNLDSFISKGTCFTNAFSTADHTGVSWLTILTSLFPINSKINAYNFNSSINSFVKFFKDNNYKTFCFFPDISFFNILKEQFDNSIIYDYSNRDSFLRLEGGLAKQIIEKNNSQKSTGPWFNCIHLMDLKYPFVVPVEFNQEKFGKSRQDRMLSFLDKWLGEILQSIDFKNSIVILSSDHGDYLPVTDHNLDEIPTIQNFMRKGKKIFPRLEPTGVRMFEIMKKTTGSIRKKNLEKKLSESELRSFNNRNQDVLFDEIIHVPLIFVGKDIPKMKTSSLVRHVDILPTTFSLIGLSYNEPDFDGQNLVPIMKGDRTNELIAYIESGPANENLEGEVIGLRSLHYKYFRSRSNPNTMIHLYDLMEDPLELHNIADVKIEIVENMEAKLQNFLKNDNDQKVDEITTEDRKKIEDELRKLGYI